MKRRLIALTVILGGVVAIQASLRSGETFAEDVAEIIYDKCASCHHASGIAPFSLITYNEVFNNQFAIQQSIASGEMPPWPPDTTYQNYAHERIISDAERQIIYNWIGDGAPEGDPNLTPPAPVFLAGPSLGTPDLTVAAPNYMSSANAQDDYVCFSIPTNLTSEKWIQAVEIEPGNPGIVHHCLIFIDDGSYLMDTTSGECVGPTLGTLIGEFTPGATPTIYPTSTDVKMGVRLPAGSSIVLAMHYPEGSIGQMDETKAHLYFYPDGTQDIREIKIERAIENWSFCIPANTTQAVAAQYPVGSNTTSADLTILSVFPHMHNLGSSIKSYGVDNAGDTIPMVNVNNWDFEWQGFYTFKTPQILPQGSKLYGEGTFDNTILNLNNPNNPPIMACAGLNTSDEMFLVYYMYTDYEAGDENLNIDSMLNVSLWELQARGENDEFKVVTYPNPFSEQIAFMYHLEKDASVRLNVYNAQGALVREVSRGFQQEGRQEIFWDGRNAAGSKVKDGMYFYQLIIGDQRIGGEVLMMAR